MKNKKVAVAASKSIANKYAASTLGRARIFKNKKKKKTFKKIKNIEDFLY